MLVGIRHVKFSKKLGTYVYIKENAPSKRASTHCDMTKSDPIFRSSQIARAPTHTCVPKASGSVVAAARSAAASRRPLRPIGARRAAQQAATRDGVGRKGH